MSGSTWCRSWVLAGVALALALASEGARAAPQRGEPPKAVGLLVGGIIVLSVGATIGGTLLVVSSLTSCSYYLDDEEDDKTACEEDKRNNEIVGGVVLAGSVVSGIMMIKSSNQTRKRWKEWKARQPGGKDPKGKEKAGVPPLHLQLTATPKGPAMILSHDF